MKKFILILAISLIGIGACMSLYDDLYWNCHKYNALLKVDDHFDRIPTKNCYPYWYKGGWWSE